MKIPSMLQTAVQEPACDLKKPRKSVKYITNITQYKITKCDKLFEIQQK